MRFEGKSAVITGGSEGIGFAIAAGLVKGGARVVLVARREAVLAEAVGKLGPNARYVVGDVAAPATAERAVDEAVRRHGGLDLLVNNAALSIPGVMPELSIPDVDRMLGVNLRGPILFTQAAVRHLSGRSGAAVLNISSAAVWKPVVGISIYGATKAALNHLTQSWAMELAPRGIRVNAISPGPAYTPMFQQVADAIPGHEERLKAMSLVRRIATAEEMARPALALLDSNETSYVTGAIWDVDGGYRLGS